MHCRISVTVYEEIHFLSYLVCNISGYVFSVWPFPMIARIYLYLGLGHEIIVCALYVAVSLWVPNFKILPHLSSIK